MAAGILCARCNTENSASARFCNACGSPLPRICAHCGASLFSTARFCEGCGSEAISSPSGPSDKPRGSALTPHADKELDAPFRAAAIQQITTPTDPAPLPNQPSPHAKLSTEPRPLYVRPVATVPPARDPGPARSGAAAPGIKPWQWGLASASAAVFLFNFGAVMALTLSWLMHRTSSTAIHPFVYFALTGAGGCLLALALADSKTTLTVIAGGVLLHSLLILPLAFAGRYRIDWLLLLALGAGGLWWIWLGLPRQRGDASRLSVALTVLVAGFLLGRIYFFARYHGAIQIKNLAVLAIVAGSLLGLRVWLPSLVGESGAAQFKPSARRMQAIAVVIILIVIRVLFRLALHH